MTQSNINLGLPAFPETDDPKIYDALMPLYSALRTLASGVDSLTGTRYVQNDEYPYQADGNSLIIGNQCKIYRKFGEAVSAGNTVRLVTSGSTTLAYKGTNGTVIGMAAGDYAVGEWGCIILWGLVTIQGLTPDVAYAAHPTAGMIALASAVPSNQRIGIALSNESFFLRPNLP